jgi:hypothetical protein
VAPELFLVNYLLVVIAAGVFFAHCQDVLILWMGNCDVLFGVTFLLAGILVFLVILVLGTAYWTLYTVGQNTHLNQLRELGDNFFEGVASRSFWTNVSTL